MPNKSSSWFSPVPGDEHILIGRDSPLRRIPANVDREQAVFLDGIRHAIEIMDVGFHRLRNGLTKAALEPPNSTELPLVGAGLFLDAWAVVDAIDRFRQLYQGFPGMTRINAPEDIQPLRESLKIFRDLRNVGDHIATRVPEIVSKGDGAALGELTWLTGAQLLPKVVAWHCVLRPGTFQSRPSPPTNAIETKLDWPTDYICLKAGGYQGNLSQVRTKIAGRVRHLESQLDATFLLPKFENVPVINDFFGRRPVQPSYDDLDTEDSVLN